MTDAIYFDEILCMNCDAKSSVEQGVNTCPNCLTEGMNVWAETEDYS